MARTAYRLIYLVVLTTVLVHLLVYPARWEEERLSVGLLAALHVRELAATLRALWRTGQRWQRYWKRRRRVQRATLHASPHWRAWIAQLLPDPEPLPWAERAAFAALKESVEGLFQLLPEATCAAWFRRLRWLGGVRCPYCDSSDVRVKDPHYRDHRHRYTCHPCSQAQGREVTFTDLHGTIVEHSHLEVRYWLWAAWLWVTGESIARIHKELSINRKTAERMVRLFQLAYFTLRFRLLLGGPVEIDEAYVIAGHKGHAGRLPLNRPPRRRGLKKPGRGTAQTDKVPVLGLVDREGAVYLIPLPNVQRKTIQPIVEWLVVQGAQVYTDEYDIYRFLRRLGYRHETVEHGRKEYVRGEVHVNTLEAIWNLLKEHLAVHHGVSKLYLPLYVARFEFRHNRRQESWGSQWLDLLHLAVRADGRYLRQMVREGRVKELCMIPGLEEA
ncbi:MAG TPA: IS1595 family transposase [Anaerolineae bacterium]|nr:IS1595 family transposase [Anaerolineae bacterium]